MLIEIVAIILVHISFLESRKPFPDQTDSYFLRECLNEHNKYRRRHRAPDLRLNNSIVQYSKRRAANMSRFDGLSHGHRGLSGYGENAFWGIGGRSSFSCADGVKSWYNEYRKYDYSKPAFSTKTGHFTQLVWVNTRMFGCARTAQRRPNSQMEVYLVCNYKKPGNVRGAFGTNVLRPRNSNNKK